MARKLLIVDDEPAVAGLLKELAELKGIEVHVAGSGEEGLSAYERVKPDAVISDYKMPGMTGAEMMKELNKRGYHGRLCLHTGSLDAAKNEMIALGIYAEKENCPTVNYPTVIMGKTGNVKDIEGVYDWLFSKPAQ